MVRLPRIVSSLSLACLLAAPLSFNVAYADDAPGAVPAAPAGDTSATPPAAPAATPPPATPPAATPPAATPPAATPPADATATPAAPAADQPAQPTLAEQVDTFWHYGKMARYDLAADAGRAVLAATSDPSAILQAFEDVAGKKGDNIDFWMLRWESLPLPSQGDVAAFAPIHDMRDITGKLVARLNAGYEARRSDPTFIRTTIEEMAKGARAYDNNLPRLRKSGELAVKVLIDILRNPNDRQFNSTARRALRDLGREALNPLLAATEMKDYDTLIDVCSALGDIGYDAAVPYLAQLASNPAVPETVHSAARNALTHMGATNVADLKPANLFYSLAEKIYYGKSDIAPATDKVSYVWYWRDDVGLTKLNVPTAIFDDVLAMRAAEYSLKLDPSMGASVSLWLDANSQRETNLPVGASDPTHRGDPDAHYYNVSAGVTYCNDALTRALNDRDAAVAYKLTEALQDIIGQSNLTGSAGEPLMQALYFPNLRVRYQAAFALAESLPTKPFPGSDRVVPLLVQAMAQGAKPNVLVIAPQDNDLLNSVREAVHSIGYPVASASDPADATAAAMTLPSVDVIIISQDSDVRRMVELEKSITHLQGASMIVLTHAIDNPYAVSAATDPLMNAIVTPHKDVMSDALKSEIDQALQHSGTTTLTEQQASDYSLKAADILSKLAISGDAIFNLEASEGGVLAALNDSRGEIAKAAGQVLAALNSSSAQNGLARKAIDESTPADVRVSLFKSLANNAKFFGNHLDADQVAALEQVVTQSKNAEIRDAAAEARGALNLPADQARTLILKQSRV